jgi:ribosomal protein S18 acetylase RimI-like enzyme
MNIIKLDYKKLINQKKDLLIDIIYNNFIYLDPEPKLNHNPESIKKTLDSKDAILFLFINEGKIGAYLLGEILILEDGRKVLFISYIYVAKSLRSANIGTSLLKQAEKYGNEQYCDGLMLIYDTRIKELRRFYDKNGFLLDFNLRRYENNDVFYKLL